MTKDTPPSGSGGADENGKGSEKVVKIVQSTPMPEFSPKVGTWEEWRERLELQFCEEDITEDRIKKNTLLRAMGNEAYSLVRTLCDPRLPTDKTYAELCDIMAEHYMPPIIIFRERQNFYTAIKGSDESVTDWFSHVKHLAKKCKFKDLDEAVRDKFIMGLSNEKQIFEKLCELDEKLTSADALRKQASTTTVHQRATRTARATPTTITVTRETLVSIVVGNRTSHRCVNSRIRLATFAAKKDIYLQFADQKRRKILILLILKKN